jgi:hypothetical protein
MKIHITFSKIGGKESQSMIEEMVVVLIGEVVLIGIEIQRTCQVQCVKPMKDIIRVSIPTLIDEKSSVNVRGDAGLIPHQTVVTAVKMFFTRERGAGMQNFIQPRCKPRKYTITFRSPEEYLLHLIYVT